MEEDRNSNLEEGEISDTEYTPLERPTNYSTVTQAISNVSAYIESEDEEDELKSSSDSNSDDDIQPKRQKLKPKIRTLPKDSTRKKNNIWCNSAQEDVLLENLVNCDVSNIDRSRNVETYITLKTNKRSYSDINNSSLRPRKRTDFINRDGRTGEKRVIVDLNFTINDSEEDIARDIANKLCEEKEGLIQLVVTVAGKAKAFEFFKETQQIEEDGGMLICNRSRRRTPGGVFLYLVKNDGELTYEQINQIFSEDKQKLKQEFRIRKKIKAQILKQKVKAAGSKLLPQLLSHRELELQSKTKKETVEVDVKNPPPSPATDGLDNSTDETENFINSDCVASRNVVDYEDDCLDIGVDMEELL